MQAGERIGYRVPFSEEYRPIQVCHLLIVSDYEGLAHRLCDRGKVVNPALATDETRHRCRTCERIAR